MTHNDTALLTKVAAGDEAAFNKLFDAHKDRLYYYMLKITKSSEVAEEIVMDVFLKLWIGRKLLTEVRHFESFIHKVAYYKALNFLKKVSRQSILKQAYIARMENVTELAADELLINAEVRELLNSAVKQLPPKRKMIYMLSRERGLTHKQIAEALNISVNTVKNNMVSANKSISKYLLNSNLGKAAFLNTFLLF